MDVTRFFDRVGRTDNDDNCWDWALRPDKNGYGTFFLGNGNLPRETKAHRAAYCIEHGLDISELDGYVIMHFCNRNICVNPKHLYIGTQLDCQRKKWVRGRGKQHRPTALTDSEVLEMVRLWRQGMTPKQLCKIYDVSRTAVYAIIGGRTWSHLTGLVNQS